MGRRDRALVFRDRERVARGGLAEFIKLAWEHVDPSPLRWNWHHDVICDRLERVTAGEIRKLCIMVPPGTSKTLITSVFWPAWVWLQRPQTRFITASYGDISLDAARAHRDLVQLPWFQARWPDCNIPYQNTRAASLFKNNRGGRRFSTSVGGALTGRHAHILLGDDLNKAQDALGGAAYTLTKLDDSWRFWSQVLPTRQVDPQTTARVLIAQRLHEKDVPGRWIESDPEVEVLCLPMHRSDTHPFACPRSEEGRPGDDREEGELLWPDHLPEEAVRDLELALGPRDAAAQLEQLPSPEGGLIFQRDWLNWYDPTKPWAKHDRARLTQHWDTNLDETPGGSFIVGQVWAFDGADARLVDQARGRWGFTEAAEALVDLVLAHPDSGREIVIENKAAGPALANHLENAYRDICRRRGIADPPPIKIEKWNPQGSKLARAQGVTGLWKGGHVWLPEGRPWVEEWIREHLMFTGAGAETNDQVDAMSQALTYLFGTASQRWAEAMKKAGRIMRGAA